MNSPNKNSRHGAALRRDVVAVEAANQMRPSIFGKKFHKQEKKPEFSEKVRKLARKMMSRVKFYLAVNKAKQEGKANFERDLSNPAYSRLVRVLQNTFRSTASAEFILEYLKQLSFFANFIRDLGDVSETAITELCKCVKYEHLPAACIVFKEGDVSNDKFYVLLKGTVSVVKAQDTNVFVQMNKNLAKEVTRKIKIVKNKAIVDEDEDEPSKEETITISEDEAEDEENPSETQSRVQALVVSLGNKLSDMKEGEGFGDKALLAKDSKRTASIVTNEPCDFLVLMKKDYVDIITRYDKRRTTKIAFMNKSIPFLDNIISSEIMENLFYLIKEMDYSKGSVIVPEGSPGRGIFFVQDGYCNIEKTIVSDIKSSSNAPLKVKRKLATFGPGNCLGEEALLSLTPKYEYSIVASSSLVKLYFVEKLNFLSRFPRETTQAILDSFRRKEVVHQEKIKKVVESLNNLTIGRPAESLIRNDNLAQMMHPALQNAMYSHMRMTTQQSPKNLGSESPLLRSHDPEFSPQITSTKEPKSLKEDVFARAGRPNPHIEKNLRGGRNSIGLDNSTSQATLYDIKMTTNDEINMSESPRVRTKGISHSMVPQSPTAFHAKRLETRIDTIIPERRQSNGKLKLIGSFENLQEKKIPLTGNSTERLHLDKFDFGTPTSAKHQVKTSLFRQEKKQSEDRSPKRRCATNEDYFTQTSESPTSANSRKVLAIRTSGGINLKITSTSKPIVWPKASNLVIHERALEPIKGPTREKKALSSEDIDSMLRFQIDKIKIEGTGKLPPEPQKKSVKDIIKDAKDLRNLPAEKLLKEKKRINDCLSQKKQREKFNTRLQTRDNVSSQTKGLESLITLH